MAIISATSIIRSLSIFHLTAAYFLLTSPLTIADQNLVFILGAAMKLPSPTSFSRPSPSTALLSAVLALSAISDLTAASLPREIFSYYWGSQAPIRLLFFFVTTFYAYAFKPGGLSLMGREFGKGAKNSRAGWDDLKNSLVFSWGFLEMVLWFWIYVTLRNERREALVMAAEKRRAEEDRL